MSGLEDRNLGEPIDGAKQKDGNVNPELKDYFGFGDFLYGPSIVEKSINTPDAKGWLLPLETIDLIIDEILKKKDINPVPKKAQENKALSNIARQIIRQCLSRSKEWNNYFHALCAYKDFCDTIGKRKGGVKEVMNKTRSELGLSPIEDKEYDAIIERLTFATEEFTSFINGLVWGIVNSAGTSPRR